MAVKDLSNNIQLTRGKKLLERFPEKIQQLQASKHTFNKIITIILSPNDKPQDTIILTDKGQGKDKKKTIEISKK